MTKRRKVLCLLAFLLAYWCGESKGQEEPGSRETEKLLKILFESKDTDARLKALEELEPVQDDKVIKKLCDLLREDKDIRIRGEIACFLQYYPDNKIVFDALINALKKSPYFGVRLWAAHSLGRISNREAIPVLMKALDDFIPAVAGSAAESLGQLYAVEAVPLLIKALREPRKDDDLFYVAFQAGCALIMIGDERAINPLLDVLKGESPPEIKKVAIQAMRSFRPRKKTTDALLMILNDKKYEDPLLRIAAILAFSGLQLDSGIDAICDLIHKDKRPEIRQISAYVLGFYGRKEEKRKKTLRYLLHLEECDFTTQCVAAKSLGEIGDKKIIPDIKKKMKEAKGDDKMLLAIALQLLGEERYFEDLKKYFLEEKAKSDILQFDIPFYLLRTGYFTPDIGVSLWRSSKIIGCKPIFDILKTLFPEGPKSKSLIKAKDCVQYWKSLRKFQKDNMDNFIGNPKKKCYLLKRSAGTTEKEAEKTTPNDKRH